MFSINDRSRQTFTVKDQEPGESLAIYAQELPENEQADVLIGVVASLGRADSARVGAFWLRHKWSRLRSAQRLVAVANCPGARGWQLEVLQTPPGDSVISWQINGATSKQPPGRPGLVVVSPQEPWRYARTITLFTAGASSQRLSSRLPFQDGDPIYLRSVYGFSIGVDDTQPSGGADQAARCFGQIVLGPTATGPVVGTEALHSWPITTPRSSFAFQPPDPALFSRNLTQLLTPYLVVSLDPDIYTPPTNAAASNVAVYMQWSARNALQEEGFRLVDVGEASNFETSEA